MSRIAWVDVFSARPLAGNPLAVVLDAEGWDAARMQAVAAELGISETVFALPPETGGSARLRIFTPARELPMAGHPVVGAAWVLRAAGRIGGRATLETRAAAMPARVRGAIATVELGVPVAGAEVDAAEVAAALGIAPAPGSTARVWSLGVPQLMLPAADLAALRAARPDAAALERLGERDGWLGVSVYALGDEDGRLRADVRHFAPLIGVPEDPVTGSAAAALGAHLVAAAGGGDLRMIVRQATAEGRGGEVAVRVASADGRPRAAWIGGAVAPLFEGTFVHA